MARIEVELQAVPEGESEYRAVAWLVVEQDGSHELRDPDGYVSHELLEIPIPTLAADGEIRRLTFETDPHEWARSLPRALRTGYLVPVVSETGGRR